MAIGRLSVGVGQKGKASPHAEYIAREGKYEKDTTVEKLEATGCGNMPKWAQAEPNFFWKMSDEYERKNGTSYREHVISLPRELNQEQRHDLIKDWIAQEIGEKHAYQYAIHNPPALDGGEQPHAHIMFSERLIDDIERDPNQYFKRYNSKNPEKGGAKKANTPKISAERKLDLKAQRNRWEILCNQHLAHAGKKARISMKSYKDRGVDYKPVSLTMAQIKEPKIKEAYIDQLHAKIDRKLAFRDAKKIGITQELSKQLAEKAAQAEQERKALLVAEKAAQAEQERKALLVAEKAAQAEQERKALLVAEKAAQAEQERKALLVAEKAAQAEQERKALLVAEKAAQAEQERKAIQERTPFDLVNIRMKSIVRPNAFGRIDDSLSGDIPIGVLIRDIINAHKKGYSADLREGNNTKLDGNVTAEGIKRFMLKNINSHDVVYDYCNLSTKEFTEKHSLRCDLDDLNKLNDINPPEPVVEPVQGVREATAMNVEQKLRADSSYDNSPNF